MNFLRVTGLDFGVTLPAVEIYRLIFERIEDTKGVCALPESIADLSVWRDGCGRTPALCPGYSKGREELMALLGL